MFARAVVIWVSLFIASQLPDNTHRNIAEGKLEASCNFLIISSSRG